LRPAPSTARSSPQTADRRWSAEIDVAPPSRLRREVARGVGFPFTVYPARG
jgi:hypothetical protein